MSIRVRPSLRSWATALLAWSLAAGVATTVAPAAAAAAPTNGLVVSYDLRSGQGTTVSDTSGNGRDGVLNGDASWASGGLKLGGTNGYVKLPNDVLKGLNQVTVTAQVKADPNQRGPMVWALGNTGGNGNGNGYLFTGGLNKTNYRTAIATGNWSTEQTTSTSSPLQQGVWTTLTYTLGTDDVATLYADGVQVAQKTGVTIDPSAIGGGTTTANYIGRAVYAADPYFAGQVRQFSIYDHSLTAAEVTTLGPAAADRVARDKAALSLGDTSSVTANLTLPTTGENGSAISWATSDGSVVQADGTITRAATARTARLTATLTAGTAGDTATDTKTFDVTVAASLTDQQRAESAVAAISVPNIDDARGNLTLPTTGSEGTTIGWASSAPAVVSTTGVVTRPENGQAAATVDLTATATVGSASATRVLTATVPAKPKAEPYAGYMFSYFTGNSLAGENIFFAASQGNNALQWTELNGGQPKLTSSFGTKGLRDPFIIRSPEGDKFYLIATDLSIGSGTSWGDAQSHGSLYLEIWESTDLVNWSAQRHVKVSPDTAGNTWAPEAYWDDTLGSYVVYWASPLYSPSDPNHTVGTYQRMLYATTRDFVSFSEPKIWQDFGAARIDSTVIKDGGTYYRFTKDEGGVTGCTDIIQEKSDSLTAADDKSVPGWSATNPNWKTVASCLGKKAGTGAVEGPTVFKANDGDTSGSKYYVFVDEFGGRGYIPLGSNSLSAPDWKVPASYRLPSSPRHGTVMPITATELARINPPVPTVKADANGLVARYTLDQTSGTTATDASGNGYDGTLTGGAAFSDGSVALNGSGAYVKLPDNLMAGLDSISVSSQVWIDPAQSGAYFLWGLGNTGGDGYGNGYLFTTGNPNRGGIASGNWSTEQVINTGANLSRGAWHTVTYTQTGNTATYYLDGVKVGQKTDVTITPGSIGNGRTTANAIGKSVYTGDRTLNGKVRDFRLYNRALSAQEVAALDPTTAPKATATVSNAGTDGWYGIGAQLTVAADGAAALQYRLGESAWADYTAPVTLAAGTSVISVRAQSSGGVWGAVQTTTVKVDLDRPAVNGSLSGRVLSVAADDITSGVAGVEYQLDGGAWTAYAGPVTLDNQAHTVGYRATDKAGNVGATGTLTVPAAVPTATVALTATGPATVDGWYNTAVLATVTAPSGYVAQYNLNNGGWRSAAQAVTISGSKEHSLQTRLLRQGIEVTGSKSAQTVRIDAGLPVTTGVRTPSSTGTPRNPVLVRLGATDALSGVHSVEYKINGGAWTTAGADELRFDTVGSYLVTYRATDRAGNVAKEKSVSVTINADPTTTLAGSTKSAAKGAFVTFTLKGFHRYDQVTLTSGGTVWGSVTTSVDGSARVTLAVPADAATGAQTVVAVGTDPAVKAQVAFTVK